MPTIALINGHAFAAGLMTAMMHDYRIMNPHRGYLCVNELEFGAPLPAPMASIFRQKVPSPNTYRNMVLEARRFNALEALKEGLVDGLGVLEETVSFSSELKLETKAKTGVYGRLKQEMWRETLAFLDSAEVDDRRMKLFVNEQKIREGDEKKRVEELERGELIGKSKLWTSRACFFWWEAVRKNITYPIPAYQTTPFHIWFGSRSVSRVLDKHLSGNEK